MRLILTLAIVTLLVAGCTTPNTGTDSSGTGTGTGAATGSGTGTGSSGTPATNPYSGPSSSTSVSGSGATFSKPIIDAWAGQYGSIDPNTKVSYAGGGSGTGQKDIIAKNVVFAGSDAPLSSADHAANPTILQFPETLGPVAIVYNLPGAAVKLDGETLGKIFTGTITKWNQVEANLPDQTITIVYRSDSSGTTYVFTDYLGKASTDWAQKAGASPTKTFPQSKSTAKQVTGQGNDGVADTVKQTAGSIGYVEFSFVKTKGLQAAPMKNKAGEFVMPSLESATAAAAKAGTLPAADGDWSAVSIVNVEGSGVYPISSFSYLLVHKSTADYGGKVSSAQLGAFRAWAWWALHDGQKYARPLGYAPLPEPVVGIGERALASLVV